MPPIIVVLAHNGSTYQLQAINPAQIVSIKHIGDHESEIILTAGKPLRVAHSIQDLLEHLDVRSNRFMRAALKIYQSLKR